MVDLDATKKEAAGRRELLTVLDLRRAPELQIFLANVSDLDFLVIKRGIASRRRLAQAIYRALVGIRASIDAVVVTPEDVEALKDGVATIVGPAMREGREVYAA